MTPATLPKEMCLVLTLRTAHVGRSGRGRIFIPSPRAEAAMGDDSRWAAPSTYWDNVQTLAGALLDGHDITHDGLDYHLSTRVHSRVDNATYDMSGYIARQRYHWLRSRATAP
jgi:hypothetical protein